MSIRTRLTGYTEQTMNNRQTGAGAYFKNYDIETDTFTTAVAAGKLLGATQGGGSFTAKPVITATEVDGVPSDAVGMENIDGWEVEITANILEVTADAIKNALGASEITSTTIGEQTYQKVTGKANIETEDYIENITFLGSMSGYDEPVIIQIFNAIAVDGINITPQDKKSSVITTKFKAHVSFDNLDEPPFAIYVPVTGTEAGDEVVEGE